MTKTLYILRHGETEYNRLGMVQGNGIDAPLNEKGEWQAGRFFEQYRDVPFQKIYVSPLQRTRQTVAGFAQKGIPVEVLPGLREISWGIQEGVAFTPETSTMYQQTCERWKNGDLTARIEGGDTPPELAELQQVAFQRILSCPEELVLICTHGRAIRIMLCWMLGYPLTMMDSFEHTNTGLYVLHHTGSQFQVRVSNEVSHLV